jgi:adenine-specific DNA-methyltransferase
MTMYEEIKETRFVPELAVKCGDALAISRKNPRRFDVVVCNPPYRKVPSKELANLSAENRAVCAGQPNLYAIFMAVSTRLARLGGRIALITPTSFLSGQYFSPLRKYLAAKTRVHQIDLVEKRQGVFVYVEQETAVTVLQRIPKTAARNVPANVFAIGSRSGAELVGSASIPVDGSLWILPRAKTDAPLLKLFATCKHTLASYGYETGIGLFVPHRNKRRTRRFRRRNLRAFPLLWSTDISRSGSLQFERQRHTKRFVLIPQRGDDVVNRLPAVALQRTTAKDDARRLVAATVEQEFVSKYGGYIGENHVVFLFETEKALCDIRLLAQILRCKTVDRIFRCMSGSVAVSTSELAALPLPNPTIVSAALAQGEKIESAVNQGYGLERATVKENTAPTRGLEEAIA